MNLQNTFYLSKSEKDSLLKSEAVFLIYRESPSDEKKEEDIFGLVPIASYIVVIIFLIDRFLGFFTGRHAGRRAWYMDVIIKPNLQKIDDFFSDIISEIEKTKNELDEEGDNSRIESARIVRNGLKKIKDLIYQFNNEFIYLVRAQDPGLEDQLLTKVELTHDIASKQLGNPNIHNINIENIKNQIFESKIQFYVTLYASIRFKSIWTTMWEHIKRPFKWIDKVTPKYEESYYQL